VLLNVFCLSFIVSGEDGAVSSIDDIPFEPAHLRAARARGRHLQYKKQLAGTVNPLQTDHIVFSSVARMVFGEISGCRTRYRCLCNFFASQSEDLRVPPTHSTPIAVHSEEGR